MEPDVTTVREVANELTDACCDDPLACTKEYLRRKAVDAVEAAARDACIAFAIAQVRGLHQSALAYDNGVNGHWCAASVFSVCRKLAELEALRADSGAEIAT